MDLAFVGSLNAQPLAVAAALPAPSADVSNARLTIRVLAARDSSVLRDAEAVVDDSLLVRPNTRGDLRISELHEGMHAITVRRLGFTPVTWSLDLTRAEARVDTVFLERLPPLLAEVKVRGRMVVVPARFVDVLRRAESGWGTLFTREDLKTAPDVKSLLSQLPGVYTSDKAVAFSRCGAQLDPHAPKKVQVYVDGVRVTMLPQVPSPEAKGAGSDDEITMIFKSVNPSAIEFIEVYRGVAQIPADFVNDACAVIAIWTKAY